MKKEINFFIFSFIFMGMLLMVTNSCKKDDNGNPTEQIPVLTTTAVSNITQTAASCGGNITSDGGATITTRGVCWSASQNPTITDSKTSDGTGAGSFTSNITGLIDGTIYYIRAYATNSAGIGYGSAISFTTQGGTGTLTYIDGNVYHTVTIGTQVWMLENLKTTKYRDGTNIPNITDNTAWGYLTTGAYSDSDNTPSNSATYGRLYNWYAVTDAHNICPTGWHIPTDTEWTVLENYLIANDYNYNGTTTGNNYAKSLAATTNWEYSTTIGAVGNTDYPTYRNKTGFTALPGGYRVVDGTFYSIGYSGSWWSSTEHGVIYAWYRYMNHSYACVIRFNFYKSYGLSVRCVRD